MHLEKTVQANHPKDFCVCKLHVTSGLKKANDKMHHMPIFWNQTEYQCDNTRIRLSLLQDDEEETDRLNESTDSDSDESQISYDSSDTEDVQEEEKPAVPTTEINLRSCLRVQMNDSQRETEGKHVSFDDEIKVYPALKMKRSSSRVNRNIKVWTQCKNVSLILPIHFFFFVLSVHINLDICLNTLKMKLRIHFSMLN